MSSSLENKKEIIINYIQKYIERGRIVDFDRLIHFIRNKCAKNSININNQGIKLILKSLLQERIIVNRSTLHRDGILENQNRKQIYDIIVKNPGIYFYRIIKDSNLSNRIVAWHINILLKFNFISKEKIDNHDVYFDSNMIFPNKELMYLLKKKKCNRILHKLNKEGGLTKTKLSKDLKTHYNIISKYIDKLDDIGVLNKEDYQNKTIFQINEKIKDKIIFLLES